MNSGHERLHWYHGKVCHVIQHYIDINDIHNVTCTQYYWYKLLFTGLLNNALQLEIYQYTILQITNQNDNSVSCTYIQHNNYVGSMPYITENLPPT